MERVEERLGKVEQRMDFVEQSVRETNEHLDNWGKRVERLEVNRRPRPRVRVDHYVVDLADLIFG